MFVASPAAVLGSRMLNHILIRRFPLDPLADLKADALTLFATARTRLFRFQQVMLDTLTWPIRRKSMAIVPWAMLNGDLFVHILRFCLPCLTKFKPRVLRGIKSFAPVAVLALQRQAQVVLQLTDFSEFLRITFFS